MKKKLHLVGAVLTTATIAQFLVSIMIVGAFGNLAALLLVRHYVALGQLLLIPAVLLTVFTGLALATGRRSALVQAKMRRMTVVTTLLLLLAAPAAVFLDMKASAGAFDQTFVVVQLAELMVLGVCLLLLGRNIRDGMRLSGRLSPRPPASPSG